MNLAACDFAGSFGKAPRGREYELASASDKSARFSAINLIGTRWNRNYQNFCVRPGYAS